MMGATRRLVFMMSSSGVKIFRICGAKTRASIVKTKKVKNERHERTLRYSLAFATLFLPI